MTRDAGPAGGATGGGSSAGDGFDLMAVMESLRLLKPSGNEIESIVRLRAALMKMPASAVSQLLPALRKGRWGRDSAQVAEAFFYRWAVLDAEAAWAVFREPDFLGAIDKTMRAVLLGMGKDDPARFVRLLNTLPDTETYQTEARSAIIRNLGSLPVAEVLPHLKALESTSRRRELIGLLLNRSPAAPDIGLVAPVAATLPPAEAGELIPLISKQWYHADPGGLHNWLATLPPNSSQHGAAIVGEATALSASDPAGAGKLLAGTPWNRRWQTDIKQIVTRWMEADRPGAEQWLMTDPMVPSSPRRELLGTGDKTKEGGP